MERFDEIKIEVEINNVWIDLSPDVMKTPNPRINGMGIMGLSPLDRVGGAARFTFALNNSQENSVATLGYYTPRRTGALSGWDVGLPVRCYFVYDGIYSTKFYGKIIPNGIDIETGYQGKRIVKVTAENWMREANNHTVDLIGYQTNLTADEGLEQIISNMTNVPLALNFQAGTRTFPSIFDVTSKKTKAISEINKLIMSEFGYCYMRGDHSTTAYNGGSTLAFENRTYRYGQRNIVTGIPYHSSEAGSYLLMETGDFLLLETGDKILLEASQDAVFTESDMMRLDVKYGDYIFNRVKLVSYPRDVDASPVVLWSLESPVYIAGNNSVSGIRGSFRDPNGKSASVSGVNMITPVSATDYAAYLNSDGTGTNLTANLSVVANYGTSEVEYTLTNTGATAMYVTLLQARGYGVKIYDTASVQYESPVSIARYGIQETTIDMPYMSDASNLFSFSNSYDRMLFENGDNALMENSDYIQLDDEQGIFDLLFTDEPQWYVEKMTLNANRNKFNMLAFMTLDAGSFVKISETMTGIDTQYSYVINGWDLEINGGIVEWSPALLSTLQCPKV